MIWLFYDNAGLICEKFDRSDTSNTMRSFEDEVSVLAERSVAKRLKATLRKSEQL